MRQVTRTAGAAMASGVMVFGVAASPAAAHDLDSDRFRVTTRTVDEHYNDVGKKGPSVGDSFTFSDKLFHRGDRVGRGDGRCDVTRATKQKFTIHCAVTLTFRGRGQIATQGAFTFKRGVRSPDIIIPITGGTGKYTGAEGSIQLMEQRGEPTRLQVRLQG